MDSSDPKMWTVPNIDKHLTIFSLLFYAKWFIDENGIKLQL